MNRKLIPILVLLAVAVLLVASGCIGNKSSTTSNVGTDTLSSNGASTSSSSPSTTSNVRQAASGEKVKGTWITAEASADQISIPVKSIDDNINVHFNVTTDAGELPVMAYRYNDKIYVKSNECVPCGSIGYSLLDGTLVCDTCGTVFDAVTGDGIKGGCVAFAKASIPYTISGDKITIKTSDVVTAHKKTTKEIS